jgi:Z1 domain
LPNRPPRSEIVADIIDRLPRRKIRVVNSDGKSTQEALGAPNFIVGGNIVGRGLTIPNLLVTYYLRKPQTSQMDTMLQHARMFGYRQKLMPYSRVFLPQSLAMRFNRIHAAEAELRQLIPSVDALDTLPVEVVGELRPTRYGVLDPAEIQSVRSGHHIYPTTPDFAASKAKREAIERLLGEIFGVPDPEVAVVAASATPVEVPIPRLVELVRALDADDEGWDTDGLCQVLLSTTRQSSVGFVQWRAMRRRGKTRELATGAASGAEVGAARGRPGPTLFVFRQDEKKDVWNHEKFWYPSLVFPSSMPNKVYNRTTRES